MPVNADVSSRLLADVHFVVHLVVRLVTVTAKNAMHRSAGNVQSSSISPVISLFAIANGAIPKSSDRFEQWGLCNFCYLHLSSLRARTMGKNEFSQLTNDVLFGIKSCLFEDELGRAMLQLYENGVCDQRIAGMINHRVQKEKRRQAFCQLPFNRPKLRKGKLMLGKDMNGGFVVIPIQYLNAHSLTIANTGSGKTMKSRFLIIQIAPHVKGLWAVDLRKQEFRILRPYLKRLGIDLIIVPGRSLRINPLQVPLGVDAASWAATVASMLIQVLSLPPRASKLVQTSVFHLYHKFGILDGKDLYPTLFDLFEAIKQNKAANAQSRSAILDSLDPVLSSLGPEVLAYRRGWTTNDLASKHLVFEFAGLADGDKNLLLNTVIISEFTSRVARGISNPKMDMYVVCDEAQRLCSASSSQLAGLDDIIGIIRGTGIGADFSVLSMEGLAPQVLSNCATKIMGRCGSASDYASAGHSMGLSAEQIQWAQLNLRPGMFIGQLGEGSHRYPFVFTIPRMNFPQTVAGQQSFDDLGLLSSLLTIPAEEFQGWGDGVCDLATSSQKNYSPFESDQEYRLCKAIVENPMLASSKYPKLAGISSKTAGPLRPKLISRGLIREYALDSGGRGPSRLILEATSEGVKAIQEYESDKP